MKEFETMSRSHPPEVQRCSCHRSIVVKTLECQDLCPNCVANALQNRHQLREAALERRNVAREQCSQRLEAYSIGQRVSALSYESKVLRQKLSEIRQKSSSLAVDIAAQVLENNERRAQLESSFLPKENLKRLQKALYEPDNGAMTSELLVATNTVRKMRFLWGLHVFGMFRVDVDNNEKRPNERHRHARGIGKIGGLPLPNAGPELYGILPSKELQSALRLVAGLTSTLAKCLGVLLPHPILLQPYDYQDDIISNLSRGKKDKQCSSKKEVIPEEGSNAVTGLLSIVQSTAWGKTTQHGEIGITSQPQAHVEGKLFIPPSMDSSTVTQRLLHAKAAVIAEDDSATSSSNCRYILTPTTDDSEHFATGLQLLQNDVIALCIRVGVPVSDLWPAGAILLNLQALKIFCQLQVLECDEEVINHH